MSAIAISRTWGFWSKVDREERASSGRRPGLSGPPQPRAPRRRQRARNTAAPAAAAGRAAVPHAGVLGVRRAAVAAGVPHVPGQFHGPAAGRDLLHALHTG